MPRRPARHPGSIQAQRRTFFAAGVSLVALAGRGYGQSKPKTVRIGIVAGDLIAPHEEEEWLNGLGEQGRVEARNLILERRYAEARVEKVPGLAREFGRAAMR